MGILHPQGVCTKQWMNFFKSEGFDTIDFEESVCRRPAGGKYSDDINVLAHVDDCLIVCKSATVMTAFKQDLLSRFSKRDCPEVVDPQTLSQYCRMSFVLDGYDPT